MITIINNDNNNGSNDNLMMIMIMMIIMIMPHRAECQGDMDTCSTCQHLSVLYALNQSGNEQRGHSLLNRNEHVLQTKLLNCWMSATCQTCLCHTLKRVVKNWTNEHFVYPWASHASWRWEPAAFPHGSNICYLCEPNINVLQCCHSFINLLLRVAVNKGMSNNIGEGDPGVTIKNSSDANGKYR